MSINRAALAIGVEQQTDLTVAQAAQAVDAMLRTLVHTLASGEKVNLPGLGILEPDIRDARQGRHPQTGNPVMVPAKVIVKFRASDRLLAYANENGLLPATAAEVRLTGARPQAGT